MDSSAPTVGYTVTRQVVTLVCMLHATCMGLRINIAQFTYLITESFKAQKYTYKGVAVSHCSD